MWTSSSAATPASSVEALKLIRPRYPGVHLASSGADLHVNTWVDGVHWMNFLGQPVLGKLGGVAGLRERLALPGISTHGRGICVAPTSR